MEELLDQLEKQAIELDLRVFSVRLKIKTPHNDVILISDQTTLKGAKFIKEYSEFPVEIAFSPYGTAMLLLSGQESLPLSTRETS